VQRLTFGLPVTHQKRLIREHFTEGCAYV
jgi:hypothetical protein